MTLNIFSGEVVFRRCRGEIVSLDDMGWGLIEYYREIKGADSADGDGDGDSDSDSYGDSGVRNPSKCQMHLLVVLIRDQKNGDSRDMILSTGAVIVGV